MFILFLFLARVIGVAILGIAFFYVLLGLVIFGMTYPWPTIGVLFVIFLVLEFRKNGKENTSDWSGSRESDDSRGGSRTRRGD